MLDHILEFIIGIGIELIDGIIPSSNDSKWIGYFPILVLVLVALWIVFVVTVDFLNP